MSRTLTDDQSAEVTRLYRLPIEELTNETKFKMRVISTKTIANLSIAAAQGCPVPGLPILIYVMREMIESFGRVRVCREKCKDIERQVVNLIWLMERSQMRIKSDEIREMVGKFRESAEALNTLVKRFSKFGVLRSDLRIARSPSERDALQEKIYHYRMNPNIDVSTLPADLSLEVRCTDERPVVGSYYWIKQGKWLNRDVVALKFQKNFGVLQCSTFCGGTEDTCEKADQHVPAIKAMERFSRQVNIWRSLKHPNVLEFYGWCKIRDQMHLVTRWLESGDVRHYRKVSQLSDTAILNLVRDVALGLRYVHSKDVVHAALSPGNVLIRPDGTAAIGDFSGAKIVPANNTSLVRTDTSEEVVFMRYQAPEEHRAPRPMSKQGDIYAWSMVSLEIISGVQPFPKEKHLSVLYERIFDDKNFPALEEHPSPLWEKHPGLWGLIHSCHSLDPLARPNLDDIITKLDECIEKERASSQDFHPSPVLDQDAVCVTFSLLLLCSPALESSARLLQA
ncbi:hypothetical protein FRC04_009100 [Tulasnella sp. 424]|nr:hypothetical protein FRC04_009100 [Tulasnella sp. 424]